MENSAQSIIVKKLKPCKCEKCGEKVVPVSYGMPSYELYQESEKGKYVLAECLLPADPNEREDCACWSCHQRYKKV